jgi:hypothetical protein
MSGQNNINYNAMFSQNAGYPTQQPFNNNQNFPQLGGAPPGQQQAYSP